MKVVGKKQICRVSTWHLLIRNVKFFSRSAIRESIYPCLRTQQFVLKNIKSPWNLRKFRLTFLQSNLRRKFEMYSQSALRQSAYEPCAEKNDVRCRTKLPFGRAGRNKKPRGIKWTSDKKFGKKFKLAKNRKFPTVADGISVAIFKFQ